MADNIVSFSAFAGHLQNRIANAEGVFKEATVNLKMDNPMDMVKYNEAMQKFTSQVTLSSSLQKMYGDMVDKICGKFN